MQKFSITQDVYAKSYENRLIFYILQNKDYKRCFFCKKFAYVKKKLYLCSKFIAYK